MTDQQAFLWRQRLSQERAIRNITELHVRILLFTQGAIEAGADEMSHAEVAAALTVGTRTVGDAYRRAKALGLLDWEAQYRDVQGVRRRTVNQYRWTMPGQTAEPRPDVRRHRKPSLISKPTCSVECAEPVVGMPLHVLTRQREVLIARRWAAGQRF